jgi:hypothetical protein
VVEGNDLVSRKPLCSLTSRRSQPPLARSVPLSRFTSRVGGGSAFFVRRPMRTSHISLVLVFCLLCFGCAHRFTGDFSFKNSSTVGLWVEVSGLSNGGRDNEPPVGALAPGTIASAQMEPIRLPEEVTILWSEGTTSRTTAAEQTHTNISLTGLPRFPDSGHIYFEFTPEHTWSMRYEAR